MRRVPADAPAFDSAAATGSARAVAADPAIPSPERKTSTATIHRAVRPAIAAATDPARATTARAATAVAASLPETSKGCTLIAPWAGTTWIQVRVLMASPAMPPRTPANTTWRLDIHPAGLRRCADLVAGVLMRPPRGPPAAGSGRPRPPGAVQPPC